MFQIVIDTNVLVAALRSNRGAAFRLLSLVGDERFQINLSVAVVLEYEDALKRQGAKLTHREINDVLDYLCATANLREIFYLWRPTLRDPKDDFVLELAVESGSDFTLRLTSKISSARNASASKPLRRESFCGRLEKANERH